MSGGGSSALRIREATSSPVRETAQHHQGGRDHVLRDRDHVRASGRVNRNAARRARIEIDVVEADSEATHGDEPRPCREQRGGDSGAVADDQRTGGAETCGNGPGVLVQVGVVVNVEVGAEGVHRNGVHELGDEDVGHRSPVDIGSCRMTKGRPSLPGTRSRRREDIGGHRRHGRHCREACLRDDGHRSSAAPDAVPPGKLSGHAAARDFPGCAGRCTFAGQSPR